MSLPEPLVHVESTGGVITLDSSNFAHPHFRSTVCTFGAPFRIRIDPLCLESHIGSGRSHMGYKHVQKGHGVLQWDPRNFYSTRVNFLYFF